MLQFTVTAHCGHQQLVEVYDNAPWLDLAHKVAKARRRECDQCIKNPLAFLDEPLTDEERERAGLPLAGE